MTLMAYMAVTSTDLSSQIMETHYLQRPDGAFASFHPVHATQKLSRSVSACNALSRLRREACVPPSLEGRER